MNVNGHGFANIHPNNTNNVAYLVDFGIYCPYGHFGMAWFIHGGAQVFEFKVVLVDGFRVIAMFSMVFDTYGLAETTAVTEMRPLTLPTGVLQTWIFGTHVNHITKMIV